MHVIVQKVKGEGTRPLRMEITPKKLAFMLQVMSYYNIRVSNIARALYFAQQNMKYMCVLTSSLTWEDACHH
jgi:hypothetical protein